MKRKIRMGMVGGGPGSFIGAVHRMAANLDGQIELVCGCFSFLSGQIVRDRSVALFARGSDLWHLSGDDRARGGSACGRANGFRLYCHA